jgi:DNA-binding response OmpR family regulator
MWRDPTVLVAESDLRLRDLLRVHMENLGYEAILAPDAMVAGRAILQSSDSIDVLLVGAQLPFMSGTELVATMIADTSLRFIPTILVCTNEFDARRADTLGVPCLVTPFSVEDLAALVRSVKEKRDTRPECRIEPRSMRQRLGDLTVPVEPIKRTLRIVIADDEPDTVTSLMAILCHEGHRVFGSRNAPDVMPEVRRNKPDAVILDIDMPKISGFAIARDIREMYGDASPLLIAISGKYVGQTDRMLAENAGFDHFIQKPCDPNFVIQLLGASVPSV